MDLDQNGFHNWKNGVLTIIIGLFLMGSILFVMGVASQGTAGALSADFDIEKYYFNTGESIHLDATNSTCPAGETLLYLWDFGDGVIKNSQECTINHTYEKPNQYTITLTVSDSNSDTSSTSIMINVSDLRPILTIRPPSHPVKTNTPAVFEASPHYIVDHLVLYEWDFNGDGVTDIFSPDRKVTYTFSNVSSEFSISCHLTDHNGILSEKKTSIKIDIVKDWYLLDITSPEPISEFVVNREIFFSVTLLNETGHLLEDQSREWLHDQTGEWIFYQWDFNGDGFPDEITEENYTTHTYDRSFSDEELYTTINMSVLISNTTEIFFIQDHFEIKINPYVDSWETLSDTVVIAILAICGFIIVVGFFGTAALKKYGIPEVLSLVTLGVIMVPILGLMEPEPMFRISTVFGSLALMIILFDGGLTLNLQRVREESSRAFLLALIGFIITISTVGFFAGMLLFDNNWLVGTLFGAVIGGTSGSIVLPLISKLKVSDSTKTLVSIESTITDVLCIVVVIAIANYISPLSGSVDAGAGFKAAVSTLSGAFLKGFGSGLILGLVWITVLKKLQKFQYSFMLTIAVVFLLYSLNEYAEGSGPISVLIFGLILANGREFGAMLRIKNVSEVSKSMKDFHSQLSFIIRTFFFVFLGIIVRRELFFEVESLKIWGYGLALVVIIAFARWLAVKIVVRKGEARRDQGLLTKLLPRGLAAAVLALVPVTYHFIDNDILTKDQSDMFFNLAFVVILFSVIFTTIGVPLWQRKMRMAGYCEIDKKILKNSIEKKPERKRPVTGENDKAPLVPKKDTSKMVKDNNTKESGTKEKTSSPNKKNEPKKRKRKTDKSGRAKGGKSRQRGKTGTRGRSRKSRGKKDKGQNGQKSGLSSLQEQIDSDIEHWESEDNSSSDVDGGTSQKKADIDPSKMMARIMENELDLEDYDRGSSRRSFSKKNEQISEMLNILENDPQASILNERGSYEDTSMDYI
ncbi:MAG: cation:proton antiporter [Candidatus Thermoplasmatota archaeon]|nr:cation:proton antiporter [Candidatus Thermoplasmatota archaeon]